MSLVRDIQVPVGGTGDEPIYETRRVGWRADAVSDQECPKCWGTGRSLRPGRSINCERGIHATCIGHRDRSKCGCLCHEGGD